MYLDLGGLKQSKSDGEKRESPTPLIKSLLSASDSPGANVLIGWDPVGGRGEGVGID